MKRLIVTGIGTGVGKTLVSAIIVQALGGDYWKPVQAGSLRNTDTQRVRALVNDPNAFFHPEAYRLRQARSPHAAARSEGLRISIEGLALPKTSRPLVIEGAGGVLVPLNEVQLMIDFFKKLAAPVVLVSRHYLGSINHTLLSAEALKARRIRVAGIVFNGERNPETEEFILRRTGLPMLLRVKPEPKWNSATTRKYARLLNAEFRM
jgi:dethiobiotin synthetase